MSVRSPVFEIILERRTRRWVWSVRTTEGMVVITGSRSTRSAARYEAHGALFLTLLSAPYRSRPSRRKIQASQKAPAQRSLREVRLAAARLAVPNVAIWSGAEFEGQGLRLRAEFLLRCVVESVPFPDGRRRAFNFVDRFQNVDDQQALCNVRPHLRPAGVPHAISAREQSSLFLRFSAQHGLRSEKPRPRELTILLKSEVSLWRRDRSDPRKRESFRRLSARG